MPENRIRLSVDGQAREDWTTIVVRLGIEQLAGEFRFDYVDRGGELNQPLEFDEGDECIVAIDGEEVMVGHIDQVEISYDANTHNIAISGRGNTGDLVDSSAIHETGKWRDSLLETIANDLCSPFDVDVVIDPTAAEQALVKFPRFSIQDGEAVFEALSRLARMRGMLIVTDNGAQVRFTRAGSKRIETALELGQNVLGGTRSGDLKSRFQIYTFKSQLVGTDDFFGAVASCPKGFVTDDGIDRNRPLVVIAEDQGNANDLIRRAEWERNTRAGQSRRLSHRVQGYHHADGLWKPNEIVRVRDRFLRVDDDLLITAVTYEKASNRSVTTIQTGRPEAFDVLVPPGKRNARTQGKSWIQW
jgi:prophage tail gpP-like protein